MVNTEIFNIGPVSSILLISNCPCLVHNGYVHSKIPLNVHFQKAETHRVVSGVR